VTPDGSISERGGFARMKTVIDGVKGRYPDTFVLDAGDFSMGTPYQTIFSTEAAELRMMGLLGFDAVALGNHEFDYRAQGLTDMFHAAMGSGDTLPYVMLANVDWDATMADADLAGDARYLKAAMEVYGVVEDYAIIEKGGVKAAVFGIMGKEADSYAPESGLIFEDPIEAARRVVAQIRVGSDADIIIALSHSGLDDIPDRSECERLAAAVPEIDLIVSGHSHTRLEQPIVVGDTVIVASGEYTHDIGHIVLGRNGGRFAVESYELLPVSANLPKDSEVEAAIMGFRALVDERYLSKFGYSFDEVIAYSPFSFTPIEIFGNVQGEEPLGNLIADSYVDAVRKAEGADYRQVDVAIAPNGVIRASFAEGPITVADAFNVSSLGIGPDKVPGYPLVEVYLTGKELKTIAEVDISVSTLMSAARLYMSGLTYTYNQNRLFLNRVTDVRIMQQDGSTAELDNNALYRVVGGLYSCQMLGTVEAQSFGLLKVTPKDANGAAIVDFEEHIIYDGDMELKEWAALAGYLGSFGQVDGVALMPDYYNQLHGRKVEDTSRTPTAILKRPNHIFFLLLAAGAVLAAIVILVVKLIKRFRRCRKAKREAEA